MVAASFWTQVLVSIWPIPPSLAILLVMYLQPAAHAHSLARHVHMAHPLRRVHTSAYSHSLDLTLRLWQEGGAIYAWVAQLTMMRQVIRQNTARGGGGIHSAAAAVYVAESTISDTIVTTYGGGVETTSSVHTRGRGIGSMTIRTSVISRNIANMV
jgi:hypothetical protein